MNPGHLLKLTTQEKLSIFLALYVGAIITANLIGGKLTSLFGTPVSVAILSLPIAYVVLSATNEVWGPVLPRVFVLAAITAQIVVLVLLAVSLALPAGSRQIFPGYLEHYNAIFNVTARIIIGSIVAFLTSQLYTVWLFDKIKTKMYDKFAWLRYNTATISGQFLDTFLFMFIAFYRGDAMFTATIAITYFLFKALACIVSTPLFYAGTWWLRGPKVPPEEPLRVAVAVPQPRKR